MQMQNHAVGLRELGRFFVVASERQVSTGAPSFMPACFVDSVWHHVVNDEARYNEFCMEHVGQEVEHREAKGEGLIDWVPAYEAKYGELDRIWFTNADGVCDEARYSDYRKSKTLRAAWDCGPVLPILPNFDHEAKSADEGFNETPYSNYRRPGVLRAAWDCTPGFPSHTPANKPPEKRT